MSLNEDFECNKPECNWFENCKKFGCGTDLKEIRPLESTAKRDE